MAINLAAVGSTVGPHEFTYDWKDVALYALSLGAGPGELDLLLEPAPRVLPTFGVLPAFGLVHETLALLNIDLSRVLHSAQRTEPLRAWPAQGTVSTSATLRGVYDMRIGAMIDIATESSIDGETYTRTVWTLFVTGVGSFESERAPALLRTRPPKGATPDFTDVWTTSPAQALLYRLNGDLNPIHARPDVAVAAGLPSPILHGLCTYGYLARVAQKELSTSSSQGEIRPIRSFEARFSKPVLPGQTLLAEGYWLSPSSVALTARVRETGELAVAHAQLEFEV